VGLVVRAIIECVDLRLELREEVSEIFFGNLRHQGAPFDGAILPVSNDLSTTFHLGKGLTAAQNPFK
jgi:hypothetical protein